MRWSGGTGRSEWRRDITAGRTRRPAEGHAYVRNQGIGVCRKNKPGGGRRNKSLAAAVKAQYAEDQPAILCERPSKWRREDRDEEPWKEISIPNTQAGKLNRRGRLQVFPDTTFRHLSVISLPEVSKKIGE